MLVFSDKDSVIYDKNSIITVGTFDGVHSGHRKIISILNQKKKETGCRSVVVTFEPHPQIVLRNRDSQIRLLSTKEEKLEYFRKLGIDAVYIINFTKEFSQTHAEDFYKEYLIKDVGISGLVLGYDHMFGKNREGNFDTLKKLSDEYNFEVVKIDEYKVDKEQLSSTSIRKFLSEGEVNEANRLLGYEYSFDGIVIPGKKLGREIGYPTANIQPEEPMKVLPKDGIYAVKVLVGEIEFEGMMNIGTNPTVSNDGTKKLEVNIFDFDKQLYGEKLKIKFIERIRDELKFDSIEALVAEIDNDKKKVLEIFHK